VARSAPQNETRVLNQKNNQKNSALKAEGRRDRAQET
jgi:hypothetical protein